MILRQALKKDIPEIQRVRNSVKENTLSNPALVPDSDVEDYICNRGRGWVSELDGLITGFAIISITDKNVWALFLMPEFEKRGIGKQLHSIMLNWYFTQSHETIWLSTTPGTRAETFYKKAGWKETGTYGKGEIKFEMTFEQWAENNNLE